MWFRFPHEKFSLNSYLRFALKAKSGVDFRYSALQNSLETEKRSVLTLSSLCLSCYIRNTAWSRKKNIKRDLKHNTCTRYLLHLIASYKMTKSSFIPTNPWNESRECMSNRDYDKRFETEMNFGMSTNFEKILFRIFALYNFLCLSINLVFIPDC